MFISNTALAEKLSFVAKGTSKAAGQKYEYPLLELQNDGTIELRAFSGTTHFRVLLGRAEDKTVVFSPGSPMKLQFDPKKLIASLKNLSGQLFFHCNFNKMEIVVGNKSAKIKVNAINGQEFLSLPIVVDDLHRLRVPEVFSIGLERALFPTNSDHFNPACRGVMIKAGPSGIEYVGTDLSVISRVLDGENRLDVGPMSAIIPADAASIAIDMLSKKNIEAYVILGENNFSMSAGDYSIIASCIDAPHLAYEAIFEHFLSSGELLEIAVSRPYILNGIEFAAKHSDGTGSVQLHLQRGGMVLIGEDKEKSRGEYLLDKIVNEKEIHLSVSASRIISVLKSFSSSMLKIFVPLVEQPTTILIVPIEEGGLKTSILTQLNYNTNDPS